MTITVPMIRAGLHDAIAAQRTASGYIDNTFELLEAAKVTFDLEGLQTARVTVIGAGFSEEPIGRKPGAGLSPAKRKDVPIYVYLQANLEDPDSPGTFTLGDVDTLLGLLEELMDTASAFDISGYQWTGNQNPTDENGLPYDYHRLDEIGVFDATFIANYTRL